VKEQTTGKKYCGNCSAHNSYQYPDIVFCMNRFLRGENPVTPTLSVCSEWQTHVQKCFCVDDALKKKAEK
jgi:hypothetical protein